MLRDIQGLELDDIHFVKWGGVEGQEVVVEFM